MQNAAIDVIKPIRSFKYNKMEVVKVVNPLGLKHAVRVALIKVYRGDLSNAEAATQLKNMLMQFEKDIAEARKLVDDTISQLHEGIIDVNQAESKLLGE